MGRWEDENLNFIFKKNKNNLYLDKTGKTSSHLPT